MRILHTSDWHLGQHFMGKTRVDEHQAFLRWLIEQVKEHEVAAVVVAVQWLAKQNIRVIIPHPERNRDIQ